MQSLDMNIFNMIPDFRQSTSTKMKVERKLDQKKFCYYIENTRYNLERLFNKEHFLLENARDMTRVAREGFPNNMVEFF